MARMSVARLAALLALAVALPARALARDHGADLLVLAPADADASLAVAHEPSSLQWRVEASHGGILVLQSASAEVAVPGVDLANLSSIQATWVPQSAPASGTFSRLFGAASPSSLPFLFSAGVHVRVATTSTGSESVAATSALLNALVEAAPSPLRRLLPDMRQEGSQDVLAPSLCASTAFTRHNTSDGEACFSASFELPDDSALPQSEEWLVDHASLAGSRPRLTAVTLRPSKRDASILEVDALFAFMTPVGSLDSSALTATQGSHPRVVVVKSIDSKSDTASVVSLVDESETTSRLPRAGATNSGEIAVSILGEGFHRRVRVELTSDTVCAGDESGQGKMLIVVPLSTSVYADLDELRRMERFGELNLYSPTKHIEIERPAAVSAQHLIALEFSINKSHRLHTVEFPIHLRYQSPSNSTFYAPATLIAPDVLVSCGNIEDKQPLNHDRLLERFFSWIREDAWESTGWQRVVQPSPLSPVPVPVPVGFTPHGPLVSAITLSVTGLGALLLVYVAVSAPKRTNTSLSMWKPKAA